MPDHVECLPVMQRRKESENIQILDHHNSDCCCRLRAAMKVRRKKQIYLHHSVCGLVKRTRRLFICAPFGSSDLATRWCSQNECVHFVFVVVDPTKSSMKHHHHCRREHVDASGVGDGYSTIFQS